MTEPISNDRSFLSDAERQVVNFFERFHAVSGIIPDDDSTIDYMKTIGFKKFTKTELKVLKKDPLFIKSMSARGIVYDDPGYEAAGKLTMEQMAAVAVMTNLIDRRSDEKKLRDIGISSEKWAQWKQDRTFIQYLEGRVERQLSNSVHEAHLGLLRGVRQGNTASIKLFYEITNRYNPEAESQVNVRVVLGKVIETIQRHVKDPAVLQNLAMDLNQISIEASANPRQIKGELA